MKFKKAAALGSTALVAFGLMSTPVLAQEMQISGRTQVVDKLQISDQIQISDNIYMTSSALDGTAIFSGVGLDISGTTANAVGSVIANNTVTKIVYSIKLQEKSGSSWIDVKSWSGTKNDFSFALNENYTGTKGKTYQTYAEYTVYAGSNSVNLKHTSDPKTCN